MSTTVEQAQTQALPVPVPVPVPATIMYRGIAYAYDDEADNAWLEKEWGAVAEDATTTTTLSEFDRNRIDNYFISLFHVEDDKLKVSIALELFTWLDDCYPIRQALFAPEHDDLFVDFACLVEDLKYVPAYAAALNANYEDDLTDNEIRNFVRCWQAVLKERNRQLAEEFAAIAAHEANYCQRCDEALPADDIAHGHPYCHYCTLSIIDASFS
jgi:hypothetical protein